jgi:hypothetical protein
MRDYWLAFALSSHILELTKKEIFIEQQLDGG